MLDLYGQRGERLHLYARGQARLKAVNAQAAATPAPRPPSPAVARDVEVFNRRDWDEAARNAGRRRPAGPIDLPAARWRHADVGMFFGIYSRSAPKVRLAPAWLDGREVIAVYEEIRRWKPNYLMWLEWTDGRISFIRDYKYVRYVIDDAELALAPDTAPPGEATADG